jgi:glycosyltransferase involved in cell wall biosynthesis
MTKLAMQPYSPGNGPAPGSVPVCVIVLTRNEEANIRRCLASVAWADQVVVVDSGSTDETVAIAGMLGAQVVEQPWLGFSEQREFSIRLSTLRHDWVYFVDADEWVSPQLADEIASKLQAPSCSGYAQRFRLMFQGTWIRHCGWYNGSWIVRLVDRQYTKFDGSLVGERACVDGRIGRLVNDLVDEDCKGLATWLLKHVRYAQSDAEGRAQPRMSSRRIRAIRTRRDSRPLARAVLKDIIFPYVPAKSILVPIYMYIIRLGILDGRAGLLFCFYHAWYEVSVSAFQSEMAALKRDVV